METRKLNNYETLNFQDFEGLLVNHEDQLEHLYNPGIYGIHCFNTNKTLIQYSQDILSNIEIYFEDILCDLYENCPEINKDFKLYGLEGFAFIIIDVDPGWGSLIAQDEIVNLEKSWPYGLYKPKYG